MLASQPGYRGAQMLKRNISHNAWRALLLTIAMALGLVAGRGRAHAQPFKDNQSLANSVSNATASTVEPGADSSETGWGSDEVTARDLKGDITPGASPDGDGREDTADSSSVVQPPADNSATAQQVLELPQLVDLQNGNSSGGSQDDGQSDENQPAQSQVSPQDLANSDGLPNVPEQLGTLQDYESQVNQAPPSIVWFAPGMAAVRLAPSLPLNPPLRLPSAPLMVSPPIVLAPTSSSPFPSTSPMLMAPRTRTFGFAPRGGFMAFRR